MLAAVPDGVPDPRRVVAEAPTLHYWVYTERGNTKSECGEAAVHGKRLPRQE